jgi:hypothetical protein
MKKDLKTEQALIGMEVSEVSSSLGDQFQAEVGLDWR